jgi:hypothetical protein
MPIKDGPSCPGCGLPNYEGLCPHCRGDQDDDAQHDNTDKTSGDVLSVTRLRLCLNEIKNRHISLDQMAEASKAIEDHDAEQRSLISSLRARVEELEKALWQWSRAFKKSQRGYNADELRKMFGPYLEHGDRQGLSPREVRLLETIVDRGVSILEVDGVENWGKAGFRRQTWLAINEIRTRLDALEGNP